MIQKNAILDVADNSGARKVLCIGFLKGKKSATVGDVIVVSVKVATPKGRVSKGKVYKALIVRTKGPIRRLDGSTLRFSSNAVVLVNDQGDPLGTRVFGPVRKMPVGEYTKVMSLSVEVL